MLLAFCRLIHPFRKFLVLLFPYHDQCFKNLLDFCMKAKMEKIKHLCHYICLISCRNILQSYDYSVSSLIHCYLHFAVFSNKIYAPVSSKIVLKTFVDKNFVKREYGLKMCTVKMQYTKRVAKYIKTWICQHNVFLY